MLDKQLKQLLQAVTAPTDFEEVLAVLSKQAEGIRDKVKQPLSMAWWGSAARLTKQAKDELKQQREDS